MEHSTAGTGWGCSGQRLDSGNDEKKVNREAGCGGARGCGGGVGLLPQTAPSQCPQLQQQHASEGDGGACQRLLHPR